MKFEANGKFYTTDADTLALMRAYRDAGNAEMLGAVLELGLEFGRIKLADYSCAGLETCLSNCSHPCVQRA